MSQEMNELLGNIMLTYVLITFLITFICCISSYLSFNKQRIFTLFYEANRLEKEDQIPVSLLVPAYNEEKTICHTIDSLSYLNYKNYEIIVVNDGSTDETLQLISEKYEIKKIYKPMRKRLETEEVLDVYQGQVNGIDLIVINKVNGGKADTLNVGINYSKYPIFVTIDADSILDRNSLKKIMIPFMENRKTVAVGGNIKVANNLIIDKGNIVERLVPKGGILAHQICEYTRTFLTNRMSWNLINMNLIISGAFGAFNKNVVIEIGGYKTNTIGEDMELVMRIHKKFLKAKEEYYIKFSSDAYCYTQAPDTYKGLRIQRRRWQMGLIQSLFEHKEMFLGWNWFFAKLYYIFFECMTPIVELFGMIFLIFALIFKFLNINFVLRLYAIIIIYNFIVSFSSLLLELYAFKGETNIRVIMKLSFFALIENIGYRQLLTLYRFTAFIGYKKNKHKWGSIQRHEMLTQQQVTT